MNGPVMKVTLDVFEQGSRWFAEAREVCVVGDGETREAAVTKAKAGVLLLILHELEEGARPEADVQEVAFGIVDAARAA